MYQNYSEVHRINRLYPNLYKILAFLWVYILSVILSDYFVFDIISLNFSAMSQVNALIRIHDLTYFLE